MFETISVSVFDGQCGLCWLWQGSPYVRPANGGERGRTAGEPRGFWAFCVLRANGGERGRTGANRSEFFSLCIWVSKKHHPLANWCHDTYQKFRLQILGIFGNSDDAFDVKWCLEMVNKQFPSTKYITRQVLTSQFFASWFLKEMKKTCKFFEDIQTFWRKFSNFCYLSRRTRF